MTITAHEPIISQTEFDKITFNNLYNFYKRFIVSNFEDKCQAPHIKKLSEILTNVIFNPDFKDRVAIAMPPQHSKSSLTTVALSAWLICRNPDLRILVINSESELSSEFGIQIRNLLYHISALGFNLKVSKVKFSNTNLKLEKNGKLCRGGIRLTGAAGSITGHPADVVIVDDPYKGLEDEFTPTQLSKKWAWFTNTVEQRLRTNGKMIVLHTRWHSEDIQGQLKNDPYQKSKYHFVELPAIDKEGRPLWPEYYSLDFYKEKERIMGERKFQAIYQQQPLDLTSDFFHTDKLHWDETYKNLYSIASCRSYDMAYTSQKKALENKINADYTAGVHAEKINDNHYIFSDFLYKRLGKKNIKHIQSTARFDGLEKPILIETGPKGGAARELFDLWDVDYLTEYECHQSEPIGTKADRATALANAMYDGKIHIYCMDTELRKEIKEQLSSFPNGTKDDLVDAMAYAYNYLKNMTDGKSIYRTGNATYY